MSTTQLGPFDITLFFQKGTEITPGQMAAVDQVAVIFSPQHFKALTRSLAETLAAYEAVFGELTIPESDTTPNRSAEEIVAALSKARAAAHAKRSSSSGRQPPSSQSRASRPKKGT